MILLPHGYNTIEIEIRIHNVQMKSIVVFRPKGPISKIHIIMYTYILCEILKYSSMCILISIYYIRRYVYTGQGQIHIYIPLYHKKTGHLQIVYMIVEKIYYLFINSFLYKIRYSATLNATISVKNNILFLFVIKLTKHSICGSFFSTAIILLLCLLSPTIVRD